MLIITSMLPWELGVWLVTQQLVGCSLTRDWTLTMSVKARNPTNLTTRESQPNIFIHSSFIPRPTPELWTLLFTGNYFAFLTVSPLGSCLRGSCPFLQGALPDSLSLSNLPYSIAMSTHCILVWPPWGQHQDLSVPHSILGMHLNAESTSKSGA